MNLSKPSISSSPNDLKDLLYAGFNQDYGCFALGLESGFRIFNCEPFKENMRKEFLDGGIAQIVMLFRCNYLALIGGGRNPKYPPNKVIIWDDLRNDGEKEILELEFRSEVKNVLLRRDRIIVVLMNKVFIYTFDRKPNLLRSFETIENPTGVCALSSHSDRAVLAFPGGQKGYIQIVDLDTLPAQSKSSRGDIHGTSNSLIAHNATSGPLTPNVMLLPAHTSHLSCLAISQDGTKIASASAKGTLIRVWDATSGNKLNELRRGVDRAEIYSIAFNHDASRLCVSSDKGTVHVFNLDVSLSMAQHGPRGPHYGEIPTPPISRGVEVHRTNASLSITNTNGGNGSLNGSSSGLSSSYDTGNRHSQLAFLSGILPKYFSSEWSFALARLPTEVRCIAAFGGSRDGLGGNKNSVVVVCADGTFARYNFDPIKGGECELLEIKRFLGED